MAFSKAHKFDDAIHHFSLMCRALSHPARVMILKKLISLHGEFTSVNELFAQLPLSRPTLSQHLRILREMSLVSCEEQHPFVYYGLNPGLMNAYVGIFSLVTQAELKYDESFRQEIHALSSRHKQGTTPV